jgi:hypothetical protein
MARKLPNNRLEVSGRSAPEEETEQAVLAVQLDDVSREFVRLVDLCGAGRNALARE